MSAAGVTTSESMTFIDDTEEDLAFNTTGVNTTKAPGAQLSVNGAIELCAIADELTDYQEFCDAVERARDLVVGLTAVAEGKDPEKILVSAAK
jgi:hypothetical protein